MVIMGAQNFDYASKFPENECFWRTIFRFKKFPTAKKFRGRAIAPPEFLAVKSLFPQPQRH